MKRIAVVFALLILSMAAAAMAQTAPTIAADKPTYVAGETITLTGEGWLPGESVNIVLSEEGDEETTALHATADASGTFTITTTMPEDPVEVASSSGTVKANARRVVPNAAPNGKFHATANGLQSKASAEAQFSEGETETDGDHLLELEGYWHNRLTFPTGKFNPGWVRKAAEEDKKIAKGTPKGKKRGHGGVVSVAAKGPGGGISGLSLTDNAFTALGPQPERMTGCTGCFDYGSTQGRVNTIAIDSTTTTNGSIVAYIGTVGGGVWKTTNCCSATTSWTVLTDDPLISTTSIDSVTIDPHDHNTIYVGTGDLNYGSFSMGSQGILKSTDAGAHWTVLGADVFGPALAQTNPNFPQYQAVGKVRVDPNDSNKVVAGTKTGLYFSYDGGNNWTGPCTTNGFSTMRQDITGLELTNIAGSTRIIAAVGVRGFASTVQFNLGQNGANGIYKGTMGASGCPSFTSIAGNGNGFVFGPAAVGGSPYAANAALNAGSGSIWVNTTTGNQLGRVEIAIAPSNPDVIYAQVQSIAPNNNAGCGNTNGCQLGVFATTNGGNTWTMLTGSAGGALRNCAGGNTANNPGDYPQNWYDQGIAVDPNNADRIFVDTYDMWLANRTGTSFFDVTCGYNGSALSAHVVHTDHHAMAFVSGSSSILLEGSDGGIFSTLNAQAATATAPAVRPTWINMFTGLNTIEFYSGDISGDFANSANPQASGGAQDNGPSSVRFSGSPTGPAQWQMGLGGDGFYSRIDPVGSPTSLRFWQGNNSGGLSRCIGTPTPCTSSGATWNSKQGGWTADTQSFILPFDLFHGGIPGPDSDDCPPANATPGGCGHLIAGTTRVFETISGNVAAANGAVPWVITNNPSTQNMTKGTLGNRSFINQLKYSPKKQSIAIVGTNDANVWIGFNLGTGVAGQANWVNVTGGNAKLPLRPVLGIALDPTTTTSPIGYAAVGGFNANSTLPGHVFRVVCGATCATFTWTDKTGNLPDIPVDSVIVNPNFPQQVFAGTDFGLYYTDDITAQVPQWLRFAGLPNVMIWDMQIDRGSTTLSLWTRSRGAYAWPLSLGPENPLPTDLTTTPGVAVYGGSITLTATLTSGGNGVPGKSIAFSANGNSVGAALTDGDGVASLTAALPKVNAASYATGVSASFAGDTIYQAETATSSLDVSKKAITVTAVTDTKQYDRTTASSATPLLTPGLSYTDTPAFLQAYDTRTAGMGKTLTPAGNVNDGNGGDNYAVTVVPDNTGVINAKPLVGSISAASKEYDGTATATITSRTLSGVIAPDVVNYIGGSALFSDANVANGKTVTGSSLSLAGPDAGNYSVNGTALTTANITPATITVTADNKSRLYSTANPPLTATFTGFKNGETLGSSSGVIGSPALTTPANIGSAVGTYPINAAVGSLSASNYVFSFVDGTLTVYLSGIVGLESASIGANKAVVDGYDSSAGYPASASSAALLLSNGPISIGGATINGHIVSAGDAVDLGSGSTVTGDVTAATTITNKGTVGGSVLPNQPSSTIVANAVPACGAYTASPSISGGRYTYSNGDLTVNGGSNVALADGTYCFHNIAISGNATVTVSGPVSIRLTGTVQVNGGSVVNTTQAPDKLQIASSYAGANGVKIAGNTAAYLTIYAPKTDVTITGGSPLFGAVLGKTLTVSGNSQIHYDVLLPQIWAVFGF